MKGKSFHVLRHRFYICEHKQHEKTSAVKSQIFLTLTGHESNSLERATSSEAYF